MTTEHSFLIRLILICLVSHSSRGGPGGGSGGPGGGFGSPGGGFLCSSSGLPLPPPWKPPPGLPKPSPGPPEPPPGPPRDELEMRQGRMTRIRNECSVARGGGEHPDKNKINEKSNMLRSCTDERTSMQLENGAYCIGTLADP